MLQGEPALWHVLHDDGDEEDLEEFEMQEVLLARQAARSFADLLTYTLIRSDYLPQALDNFRNDVQDDTAPHLTYVNIWNS